MQPPVNPSRFFPQEERFLEYVRANKNVGYGAMMHLISEEWRKQDPKGALSVGPCYGVLEACANTMESKVVVVVPVDLTAWEIKQRLRPHMTQVEVVGEGGKPTDIICSGTVAGWNALLGGRHDV